MAATRSFNTKNVILFLARDRLPWPDGSMDAITCMHLVEHLQDMHFLVREVRRLLAPAGRVYFETPHPKSLELPNFKGESGGRFTLNFFDDPTHVRVVPTALLAERARGEGLEVVGGGDLRNWLFAASHLVYRFLPASRQKFTAQVHWLGWSAFLTARPAFVKPKLLVIELWGVGDLAIAIRSCAGRVRNLRGDPGQTVRAGLALPFLADGGGHHV